ncbi:MAG: S-layer homology domain-containing protein [Clostridiales bacterium]|nr:S-layer homology domain-containing protein [Clostridiales bacterium]
MNTLKKKIARLLVPILLLTIPIRPYAQIVVGEKAEKAMQLLNETMTTTSGGLATTTGGAYGLNERIQITTDGAYTIDELIEGIEGYVSNLNTEGEDGRALLDLSLYPYAFKAAHIDPTQFDRNGIGESSYKHSATRLQERAPQADIVGRAEAILDAIALGEDASSLVEDLLSTQAETGYFKDPNETVRLEKDGVAQARAILALEAYYGTDVEVEWPNYEEGKDYGYVGALKKVLSMQGASGDFTGYIFNTMMPGKFTYVQDKNLATQLIVGLLSGHVEDEIILKEDGTTLGEICREAIYQGLKFINSETNTGLNDIYYLIPMWIALGQPEKIEEHELLNKLKRYRNEDGSGGYRISRASGVKCKEYDTQQVLIALSDLKEGEVSWRRIVTPQAKSVRSILETLRGLEVPHVTKVDIDLPTQGVQGTTISWESNHEEIITPDGKVVQPSYTTQVTLTATFTNGEVEKQKTYVISVEGTEQPKEEILLGKAFESFYNTYGQDISSLDYRGTFVLASSNQDNSEYTLYDVKNHKDGDFTQYTATDYAGVIMQLILEGKNPYYYEGINYIALLEDYLQVHPILGVDDEGAWAVLALDAAGAKVSQKQIDQLVEVIHSEKAPLKAKGLSLVALMQHEEEVGETTLDEVIRIVQAYEVRMGSDAGTFKEGENFDLETHAYVVMGLVAAGEDLSRAPYVWEEKDPIDILGRELESINLARIIALGDLVQGSNIWQRMDLDANKVKDLGDRVNALLKTDLSIYDQSCVESLKLAYDNMNSILVVQGSIKGYGERYFALQQALKDILASTSLTEEELYTPESYAVYKQAKEDLNALFEKEEITSHQLIEGARNVIEAYKQLELRDPQEDVVLKMFSLELEGIETVQRITAETSIAQEEAKLILDKTLKGMEKEYGKDISRQGYWGVFRLASAGIDLTDYKVYDVTTHKNGDFGTYQATDYAAIILQLVIMGENPYNYKGINYVEKLQALEKVGGVYGPYANNIWALYALDAAGATYNEALINIVKDQAADDTFDLDMRGWALIGIQNHKDVVGQAEMQEIIDSFKDRQVQEGEYRSTFDHIQYQNQNISTHSCVVAGLVAAGEDVTSEKWTIAGQNPLDIIKKAQLDDGRFIAIPNMDFKDFDKDAIIALGTIVQGTNVWQRQYLTRAHLDGVIEQAKLILEGDVTSCPKEQVEALRWTYNEAMRVPEGKIKGYGEHYFRLKELIEKMTSHKLPYFTDCALYTAESFKVFENEAMALTIVTHNANATAHEIYERCQAIILAHEQLQEVSTPGPDPDPDDKEMITVTFELIGDSVHETADKHVDFETWIPERSITVPEGSVVFDVFHKALSEAGLSYDESQPGYIGGIQSPRGEWLREFSNGIHSGWMYTVNGDHPLYGLRQYPVYEGDHIVWHYTDDYMKEEGSEHWGSNTDGGNVVGQSATVTLRPVKVQGGTAYFTFEFNQKTQFINQLQSNDKEDSLAQIKVELPDEAVGISLKLPSEVVEALGQTQHTTLQIVTEWATFTLDEKALKQMVKEADEKAIDFTLKQLHQKDLRQEIKEQIGEGTTLVFNLQTAQKDSLSLGEEKIEVAVPYKLKDTQEPEYLKVYWVTEDEQLQLIEGSLYDKDTKTVLFRTSNCGEFIVLYEEPKEEGAPVHHFTDIETSWAKEYIEYLMAKGLIKGKTETTFAPNDWITRAEFVQILAHMSQVDLSLYTESTFQDVQDIDWFMPAVAWAKAMGIVQGSGTCFNPQETITRQDMAVILYRYMSQVQHYTWDNATKRELFADDKVIKAYAREAVYAMKAANIVDGREHGNFAPLAQATRAEVAKMIALLLQSLEE